MNFEHNPFRCGACFDADSAADGRRIKGVLQNVSEGYCERPAWPWKGLPVKVARDCYGNVLGASQVVQGQCDYVINSGLGDSVLVVHLRGQAIEDVAATGYLVAKHGCVFGQLYVIGIAA
jgi:hypothetical protein